MNDYKLLFEQGIDVPNRTIYLHEEIDSETSFKIRAGLALMLGNKPIIIDINSLGGSAIDGFCVYEILKRYDKSPIITFNSGCTMSAALLIFMAGDKRLGLNYCEFLFHGAKDHSDFYGADPKGLEIASKQLKVMNNEMAQLMADVTKKEKRYWSGKVKGDFTFKKKEALDLGVVTEE